ncbi:unnamed protein product, partial [Ectocarpus sp. 8 AP-2014]
YSLTPTGIFIFKAERGFTIIEPPIIRSWGWMPPRSPAGPPMRRRGRDREGVVDDPAAAADWKQQQHQSSSQFSRLARGTSVSFSAMETTAEEDGDSDDDAAEPPGGGGGGARLSRWLGSREPL